VEARRPPRTWFESVLHVDVPVVVEAIMITPRPIFSLLGILVKSCDTRMYIAVPSLLFSSRAMQFGVARAVLFPSRAMQLCVVPAEF
jgi:hypothetical protein